MPQTPNLHAPNTASHDAEWKTYSLTENGAGQWDELTGEMVGFWADPLAARNALTGKKITLPGMTGGYGFYIAGGSLSTSWAANGRVRAEFTAPGLFQRKIKLSKGTRADSYSLTDITTNAIPGLPNATYPRLNYRNMVRTYDVSAAWLTSPGTDIYDLANVGAPITGHWAATAAGLSLAGAPGGEVDPFAGNLDAECTHHYPRRWSYEVVPGDRIGPENGGFALAVFRFSWQWPKTL